MWLIFICQVMITCCILCNAQMPHGKCEWKYFQEIDSFGWLNYSVQNSLKLNQKYIIYLYASMSNRNLHHKKLVLSPSETWCDDWLSHQESGHTFVKLEGNWGWGCRNIHQKLNQRLNNELSPEVKCTASLTEHNKSVLIDHATQENHTIHWTKAVVIDRESDQPNQVDQRSSAHLKWRSTSHELRQGQLSTQSCLWPLSWHDSQLSRKVSQGPSTSFFCWRLKRQGK